MQNVVFFHACSKVGVRRHSQKDKQDRRALLFHSGNVEHCSLQNLTEPELLDVLAGYLPSDENGYNKAKISISDMTGDVAYVCPTQQAARVSVAPVYCVDESGNPERIRTEPQLFWYFVFPKLNKHKDPSLHQVGRSSFSTALWLVKSL